MPAIDALKLAGFMLEARANSPHSRGAVARRRRPESL